MSKENPFVKTYNIGGIDPKYLRYVEIVDLCDTGEIRWFVKDSFDNTTPIFDNTPVFIALNDKKCIFLGSYDGRTKLFIAEGSDKNQKFYKKIELEGNPKRITDIDSKHAIVYSYDESYLFDKEKLKRTSDFFDKINVNVVENEKVFSFEKEVKDVELNISKKIVGTVSKSGRIGNFVYDESINGLRSTPKLNNEESYDVLDLNVLHEELIKLDEKNKKEKQESIKRLARINKI